MLIVNNVYTCSSVTFPTLVGSLGVDSTSAKKVENNSKDMRIPINKQLQESEREQERARERNRREMICFKEMGSKDSLLQCRLSLKECVH